MSNQIVKQGATQQTHPHTGSPGAGKFAQRMMAHEIDQKKRREEFAALAQKQDKRPIHNDISRTEII
ncbi:MAG: hypothetical protein Q7K40_01660 [bacterium]|nr:hypothetical protein [bacterium]